MSAHSGRDHDLRQRLPERGFEANIGTGIDIDTTMK
jgi:hypothetical protein